MSPNTCTIKELCYIQIGGGGHRSENYMIHCLYSCLFKPKFVIKFDGNNTVFNPTHKHLMIINISATLFFYIQIMRIELNGIILYTVTQDETYDSQLESLYNPILKCKLI